MNECKLSEINWTKVAVFAGGDRGHYRTDFDCFVGCGSRLTLGTGGKTSSCFSRWGF